MATIGQIDGSKWMGSPITVPVTSGVIAGQPTFRRVHLQVVVNSTNEFDFAMPVTADGEVVQMDVSSALRAIAEQYEYAPTELNPYTWVPPVEPGEEPVATQTYPHYNMQLRARDEYLMDGVERTSSWTEMVDTGWYLVGQLTDRERLTDERPAKYSRKPQTSREICFSGAKHITVSATTNEPTVGTITVPSGTSGGANIYGIAKPKYGYELRFINSLGVHENVFVHHLPQSEAQVQTDKYTISRQETLRKMSRAVAVKKNMREVWKFSSGPLDEAWQRWYIHELLMVQTAWLLVDGAWIGVNVVPEETVVIADRSKQDIHEVVFALEFDIEGSPKL